MTFKKTTPEEHDEQLVPITDIEFCEIMGAKGFIGYVSFVLYGTIKIKYAEVYTKLGKGSFRIRYPYKSFINRDGEIVKTDESCVHPISSQVGVYIERVVSDYISSIIAR